MYSVSAASEMSVRTNDPDITDPKTAAVGTRGHSFPLNIKMTREEVLIPQNTFKTKIYF